MLWNPKPRKPRARRAGLTFEALEPRELKSVAPTSVMSASSLGRRPGDVSTIHAEKSSSARVGPNKYISNVLNAAIQQAGVPGMSAAVIVGKRVYVGAAGVRLSGNPTRVLPSDQFMLGSCTKSMTATLAGILVDRGLIGWSTTLAQVFPELQSTMNPQYRSVTLAELLSHRGGLVDNTVTSDPGVIASFLGSSELSPMQQRASVAPAVLSIAPGGAKGDFSYSNVGVTLAATMMERVTHKSYESMMQRFIFAPLGIRSAGFGPPGAIINGRPTQPVTRSQDGTPILPNSPQYAQLDPYAYDPAGTNLHMNVRDWTKYIRFQMGETVNGARLLRPQTLAQIHSAYPGPSPQGFQGLFESYGYGWTQRSADFGGRNPSLGPSLWHDGSDNVWLAMVEAFPSKHFAVLLMSNSTFDKSGNDIEITVFNPIEQTLIDHFYLGHDGSQARG